uniref:Uncharacterized protein n=1 Tax=Myoviridae sp. ctqfO1 TaxID=2827710 RepID=A0A8S5T387_9CAUD|nr:MAG TPA: hypothetical protein [Myoviridae sp. ctqfO1]
MLLFFNLFNLLYIIRNPPALVTLSASRSDYGKIPEPYWENPIVVLGKSQ